MNRFVLITTLLLMALSPPLAQAQQEQRAQDALRRLDQQIQTAQNLIRAFPDQQAEGLLQQAVQLREEGMEQLRARQWRQAEAKLLASLQLTDRVINLLSQAPLERARQEAETWLQRAESQVPQSGDQEANRLYRQAVRNHQEGETLRRRGDMRKAIELYRVAKFMAEQSFRKVTQTSLSANPRLESEAEKFRNLTDRARQAVETCNNPQASKLVQQAQNQRPAIERALNANKSDLARSLYQNATRLLLRAIDLCDGKEISLRQQALEDLEWLEQMIQSYPIQSSPSRRRDQFFLDRLQRLYNEARQAIAEEKYERALQKISLARALTSRLLNPATLGDYHQRAETELQRLHNELNRWQNKSDSMNGQQQIVLHAAQKSVTAAEQQLQNGRLIRALQSILAANRFLSTLEAGPAVRVLSHEQVQLQLERLQNDFDRINRDTNLEPELLQAAEEMLQEAGTAFQQDHLELAREYIQLGNNLVQKAREN